MRRSASLLMILLFFNQVIPLNLFCQTLLTAQVLNVSESYIEINRGTDHGLKVGYEGVIYFTERVWGRTEQVIVAKVKVISVMVNTAKLEVVNSTAAIMDGYLVDLSFIEKKGGSKWWIWLLVAAAGSGIAVAVRGGGGSSAPPPTTGTITYDIPAD